MDPITVIGLAAAIAQLAELGIKVVQQVSDFSRVADEVPKAFQQIATVLPLIIDGLRRIQNAIEAGGIDEVTQKTLEPVVQGCLAETEVDKILQKPLPATGAPSCQRWRTALASFAYDKKLEQAAESLSGYIMTLTFHQPLWLVPFDRNGKFVGRNDCFEMIEKAFAEGGQPKAAVWLGRYREISDCPRVLLDALEYIPLAITQAVAFMTKRRKMIQQYLEQYRKNDTTKTRLLSYEFLDHAGPLNSMHSVAKTWILSFESIRDSNKRAADLLCLINFFQHQAIPMLLLRDKDEDEFDFEDATALLKAFSFMDADENNSVFSTHRLVQLATRGWLEKETPGEVDRWAEAALTSLVFHFPEPTYHPHLDYFQLSEKLLPHAELVLRHQFKSTAERVEIVRAKLLESTGRYIHRNGNYDEGRMRFEQAMEINKKYLGEKHIDTMGGTELLGWSLVGIEDTQAIPLLERLVEIRTETLGEDDPSTIDALSDFAAALTLTQDFARSEQIQRDAVSRAERVLGPRHLDTLNCMSHLASVLDD